MHATHQLTHEKTMFDLDLSIMYQGENDPVTLSLLHWHEFIEIILCVEKGHIFTVDDKSVELDAGDILVMGSNILHSSFRPSQFVGKQYVIRFHPDMLSVLNSTIVKKKYSNMFLSYASPYSYHIIHNKALFDECIKIVQQMYSLQDINDENALLAHAYFLIMIHAFLKSKEFSTDNFNASKKFTETMEAIKESAVYIQTHYNEKITLEDMSKRANVSYSYYSQLFKEIMGKSFSEFLNTVRIAAAEELIIHNKGSMKDISEQVGIFPQSSFNHTYKKIRGISPKEFKIKYNKKNKKGAVAK